MAIASQRTARFTRGLIFSMGLVAIAIFALKSDSPVSAKAPNSGFAPDQVREINKRVAEKWQQNKITPSRPATDYEFIRRASLDIVGRIAKPDEISRFLSDPPATRRSLLIERLLKSDDYARNWATMWTVWLMTRSAEPVYREEMHLWLEDRFSRADYGWDKIVTELLTATGKNNENGAVNYILKNVGEANPKDKEAEEGQFNMVPLTSRTTRLFLGLQTQCVQCHDHPFHGEWKQKHFWGINAFFRQIEAKGMMARRRRNTPPPVLELSDNSKWNLDEEGKPGIIFYEQRNGVLRSARPQFRLPTDKDKLAPVTTGSRRHQLAEYITHDDYFAKAYINRMWNHFFGHGMNSPGSFDDLSGENEITHPELMEYLAKEFRNYGYNPRELIRWICNSEAYGLSSVANASNEKAEAEPFFGRMLLKSMSPEQLFESLMVATDAESTMTKEQKKELRQKWLSKLVVNFGDDEGNEASFNGTVVQALIMMNGKEINDAITHKDRGPVAKAFVKAKGRPSPQTMMDAIFLMVLNRKPTAKEHSLITQSLNKARVPDRDALAPWQDLQWALINSNEFILNH